MTIHRFTGSAVLRALALGAATAVCTVSAVLPAQAAAPAPPAPPARHLALPVPGGPHRVGETELQLVDPSRSDPWHPEQPERRLMVSVFYPAVHTAGHRDAPYMRPKAAAHFDTADAPGLVDLTPGQADWAGTVTHVAQDAPAAEGSFPVVLYSPGLGEPRTWGTALVADLASRGYVVVTVDNTYESPEVQFPDGSLAIWSPPDVSGADAYIRKALDVRVADTRFVLDQLARLNSGGRLAGRLDLSEVGMFGHSMGGTAAADAMAADPRIAAGIDMDGNLTEFDGSLMPVAQHGLDRPFLLLGDDDPNTDTGPGWRAFEAHSPGWNRELRLSGSMHASFTDAEALLPQLGLTPEQQAKEIGTLDPATAISTDEAYVAAYFDHYLRGCAGAGRLLDGPSARYPAMQFVH